MIASLRGTLAHKGLDRVVVDVGGVGYLAFVSMHSLGELPAEGEPVTVLCHTHVREDALQIYAFTTELERRVFELLILVSGVGPRLALVALAGMPLSDLITAVAEGDHKRLQTIPGIGKRTAERVVVELKERCAKLARELTLPAADHSPAAPAMDEVVEALVNLGYRRPQADKAVKVALERAGGAGQKVATEQVLRTALAIIREV